MFPRFPDKSKTCLHFYLLRILENAVCQGAWNSHLRNSCRRLRIVHVSPEVAQVIGCDISYFYLGQNIVQVMREGRKSAVSSAGHFTGGKCPLKCHQCMGWGHYKRNWTNRKPIQTAVEWGILHGEVPLEGYASKGWYLGLNNTTAIWRERCSL